VIKTIDSLKPKSSKGFDKVSNKLLKYVKNELANPLTKLINQMLNDSKFPSLLKIAKINPIHKKDDVHNFGNYRPISVLSSVSKVFERIIYNQIYEHFQSKKLFYKSQHGFRSSHSTESAMLELLDKIINDMDENKCPINVYMDLSKAFDTLDHSILLDKLHHYGFRGNSLNLLKSYLSDRSQFVEFNNITSEPFKIKCGVPQGSILGPLMFIIYINDLPNTTNSFSPIIYADDTTLLTSLNFTSLNNSYPSLNQELNLISDWLKVNKLSLNIEKTKAMIFHTPNRRINPPTLIIDEIQIDYVEKFNFLGLIIDKNLKWNFHVDAVAKKVCKTLGIMNRLKRLLPKHALLNIYNALILSYLNYGLINWGHKADRLLKLQKRAVRIITNSPYNAHSNNLFKQLNLLKVRDLCALHDYKFCYKMYNSMLPDYFQNDMLNRLNENSSHIHFTRQAHHLRLPAVRHEFARCSISYKYPLTMNNMPHNFKSKLATHSLNGLKFYFKRLTVESYQSECNIPNCYVCQ